MPSVAQEHSLLKPKECEKSPFSCLCCLFSLSLFNIEANFLDLHFPLEVIALPDCSLVLRT